MTDVKPKRKSITESQIVHYWILWEIENKQQPPWCGDCWDWAEPACMACGIAFTKNDNRIPKRRASDADEFKQYANIWNGCGLEKAHITPWSLTHNDDPGNFVLLCSPCHARNPETLDRDAYFVWCRRRIGGWFRDAVERLGLDSHALRLANEEQMTEMAKTAWRNSEDKVRESVKAAHAEANLSMPEWIDD